MNDKKKVPSLLVTKSINPRNITVPSSQKLLLPINGIGQKNTINVIWKKEVNVHVKDHWNPFDAMDS